MIKINIYFIFLFHQQYLVSFLAITKSPSDNHFFISDFFLGIIADQVKSSWIEIFLYAESDKPHMTGGKNASLASYGWRKLFLGGHVTS